jgi:ATP-dependent Clp protease ATP-binding subunit ClpX
MTLHSIAASSITKKLRCSFCGRGRAPGRRFVSGPGVYICNECVELARRLLAEDERASHLSEH